MLRKLFIVVVLVFVCGVSFAADEFALLKEERIGDLRIDLVEKEVVKKIQCKVKRGPDKLQGADGMYHQEWVYGDCGVSLDMVSVKKGRAKSIASISATKPSTLQTKGGIRIGSTEQEVTKAYGRYRDAENSRKGENFVAGSLFGGLMFTFEKGRVTGMFLGAAAE